MRFCPLAFFASLILIYRICACDIDEKKVIHTIYTIARDYRNAKIATADTLPKADQLVSKIGEISKILEVKVKSNHDDMELWKGVRADIFSGIVILLNSCETRNLRGYLLGSLKISSTVAAVSGIEGCTLDSLILEATAILFGAFKSLFDGLNPAKDAFQEFQVENDVDLDFSEAKFYFENLLNPVLPNPDTEVLTDTLSEKEVVEETCCQFSELEAAEILRIHQKPLHLYAKISSLMLTYCNNQAIQKSDGDGNLNRCLTVIKQYCEISKTHQAFLLRILTILTSSNFKDNMVYVQKLLYHSNELFKRDISTLGFLFSPMKSYDRTKVIYEVHLHRSAYRDVLGHLLVLDNRYRLYERYAIILCRQTELRGLCYEKKPMIEDSPQGKIWKFQSVKDWTSARSMFIPRRFRVEFMTDEVEVARNQPHSYHGPFKGLAVYSSGTRFDLRNIRISIEIEEQYDPQTRICTEGGWCDTFSDDTKSFKSIHGIDVSSKVLTSIEIPEGVYVKLFTADGSIIPIVGPFSTTDLNKCKVWSWSKIVQIKKIITNKSSAHDRLYDAHTPAEVILDIGDEVLKGSEIQVSTKVKRLTEIDNAREERSDMMVVVCTRPYMKGFCIQYGSNYAIRGMFSTFQKLFQTKCKLGMLSMMIPAGTKVIGFQKINGGYSAFGPYIGPMVIDKLDYGAEYEIDILNLFKNTKTANPSMRPKFRTIKAKNFLMNGNNLRNVNSVYDYFD